MAQKVSSTNPRLEESEVRKIIDANISKLEGYNPDKHVIVVAIRGYRLDSIGEVGKNDRREWDDAHFIYTPNGMLAFNGNTDPNGYRKGSGTGGNKGMAMLNTGVWFFGKGKHKGRLGFRQACKFTVTRDGNPPYEHTDWHAINWHDGGEYSTSSLGCQTNPPSVWKRLRPFLYDALEEFENPKRAIDWGNEARAFPYILINEEDRRNGKLEV